MNRKHPRCSIGKTARTWAGLHFRNDVVVGKVIGQTVAWKVIERTQPNGG